MDVVGYERKEIERMETTFTKICMFSLKPDNLQLVKRVVALPPYSREDELNAFLSSAKRDLTAKDFRDAGFEELVDGIDTALSGIRYSRMDDNAQCYIYKYGVLLIDEQLAQLRAKTIINDERYQNVFEFRVDDDKGTHSGYRETDIQKGLDSWNLPMKLRCVLS